ncbi:MAG: sialate O-acetylesterase, partial [Clostridiales bacterium]|nr:sialate O-acetylesterase [Clostridiales bacterium]
KTVRNTWMALIPEYGTMNDIHPKVKKPVGDRLALLALNHVYGVDVESDAPELDRYYIKDNEIHLLFRKTYGGLNIKGDRAEGFELAGEDGKFFEADCSIMGSEIRLKSDKVCRPKIARYNWTNYGTVTIYNKAGIPLGGFRTSYDYTDQDEESAKE